ncbi:ABC transporter permease [Desulfatitalea alkaliphila]|uniref:Iron export ABC transporter permease subunit FetB n=1 Tax=Desulfatitalea alkaliphila TaxID=2929485 RepID=A0AA41R3R5_9BACT|nr:iron export ABC transporter permease subunit FetB [Desulfatitalea alkaliphila]MCJ8501774.1 iron export ABC transporter permease subunit FetB [Desulfatitalea alkaliphila]
MNVIVLSPLDLGLAGALVIVLALISLRMGLHLERQLLLAALRTTVQLLLIGLVLKALFSQVHPGWVALMAGVMLLAAGREVVGRQKRRFTGLWGFGLGTLSMFVSSFAITVLALIVIVGPQPWYEPRYAIPLLGMLLGNTMNGIAIGMDRLTGSAWDQRTLIEGRLMLGQTGQQAISHLRSESIRSGLIPIINAMMAAGLVSLPGMMTGQILGGSAPMDAVKYQILIMFLIAGGTGLGTMTAVWLGSKRLFDERQRLRLDRLRKG